MLCYLFYLIVLFDTIRMCDALTRKVLPHFAAHVNNDNTVDFEFDFTASLDI